MSLCHCLISLVLGVIVCPKCREHHSVLTADLKYNFELQNLVNVLKCHPTEDSGEDIIETDRPECSIKVVAHCEAKEKLSCPAHKDQEIKLFCMSCRVGMCSACDPEHSTHVCIGIEEAREELAAELNLLMAKVSESKSKLKEQFLIAEDATQSSRDSIVCCREQLNQYFDHHAENIRQEIASLQQKLTQAIEHQTELNHKLNRADTLLAKQLSADKEVVQMCDSEISKAVASAERLCSASGLELAANFQEVSSSLRALADVPHPRLTRSSQWKFCMTKNPLTADVISPDSIKVEGDGILKAVLGLNQFTVAMLQPTRYYKPELQVKITLPNGAVCNGEGVEIKPTGEWSWTVSYFLTTGSYVVKGLFTHVVLTIEVQVCGVPVEGSPFKVPCDKLLGLKLIL